MLAKLERIFTNAFSPLKIHSVETPRRALCRTYFNNLRTLPRINIRRFPVKKLYPVIFRRLKSLSRKRREVAGQHRRRSFVPLKRGLNLRTASRKEPAPNHEPQARLSILEVALPNLEDEPRNVAYFVVLELFSGPGLRPAKSPDSDARTNPSVTLFKASQRARMATASSFVIC